ncbi:MAG: hypothetical protein ACLUR9_09430 [Christensenellales bacterium]
MKRRLCAGLMAMGMLFALTACKDNTAVPEITPSEPQATMTAPPGAEATDKATPQPTLPPQATAPDQMPTQTP